MTSIIQLATPGTLVLRRVLAIVAIASLLSAAISLVHVTPSAATDVVPENCGVRPIDLVVIIDRSGSMNTSEGALTRLGWAKSAANSLVDMLDDNGGVGASGIHRVGVSSFGGTSTSRNVALSAAANEATIVGAVNAISASGGTPLDIGMNEGRDNMLAGDRATHDGVEVTQVLILLSDGNPDPDSFAPSGAEITAYQNAADKAYTVAIGPDGGNLGSGGTGVDYDLMEAIADPGHFRFVTSASGLPNLFAEIYEEIACPTGKLEVIKQLSPTTDAGRFDLWIDQQLRADEAGHGGTTGEVEVLAGSHVVAETADGETNLANYAFAISCKDTANQNQAVAATVGQGASWSVDVAASADVVCKITNARHTGSLSVTKEIKNDDGGSAECPAFSFSVNGGAPIAFEADCTNKLTVPTGTYSVTEPAVSGYATSYEGCSQMVVEKDGTASCTVKNDDMPGTLIVIKDLKSNDGGNADCSDFSFTVNGGSPIDFEADCRNDLTVDAGTYTVVETDADGYTTTYETCSQLQVANGGSATCTITNDDEPGTLIVVKDIDGGDAACSDFSFTVNGGSPIDFEADCRNDLTVDAGSYTVVETDADGYTTTYETCSNLQVPNGGSRTCTITNVRDTGTLEVVKDLSPNDDPGLFDLRVDGAVEADDASDGDGTGPLEVETGTHTVREVAGTATDLADYASSIACRTAGGEGTIIASAHGAGPLEVDVAKDADVLCVVSNTRVAVSIAKSVDQEEGSAVAPGETVHYTLDVSVNAGTATDVVVTDLLPDGLTYVDGSANPAAGFSVNGQELTWTVASLAAGTHAFEYDATVDAEASGRLVNLGCVDADQLPELVCDESGLRVPSLTIDKVADTETIVISGPADDLVATPSVVTWTISWTLVDGPVTNAVITDAIPAGFVFLDASDGGTLVDGSVTWTFPVLEANGSVTFRTTVDPETISRAEPTVNVATIDSDETAPDEGDDSVTVEVEPPVQGGTPTPKPSPNLPDTAVQLPTGADGSQSVAFALLVAVFLSSLGTLAFASVRQRRR